MKTLLGFSCETCLLLSVLFLGCLYWGEENNLLALQQAGVWWESLLALPGENVALNQDGYNFVILDGDTGKIKDRRAFSPYEDPEDSKRMAKYLKSLGDRDILLLAVREDGAIYVGDEAREALSKFGMEKDLKRKLHYGYWLVGAPGATEAVEERSKHGCTGICREGHLLRPDLKLPRTVTMYSAGWGEGDNAVIVLKGDLGSDEIETLSVSPRKTIEVKCIDGRNDKALRQVLFFVYRANREIYRDWDQEGTWSAELAPGLYEVLALPIDKDLASWRFSFQSNLEHQITKTVSFVPYHQAQLSKDRSALVLELLTADRTPFRQVWVTSVDEQGREFSEWDREGRFRLWDVIPGTYTISFKPFEGERAIPETITVQLQPGERASKRVILTLEK